MLDTQTYRFSEQIAKSLIPSWRISRIHNLDHFERNGFPVRINSFKELGQIIDTMQENRFELYMSELGGLTDSEFNEIVEACIQIVLFQITYLPSRKPVLPISTLLSVFTLKCKFLGANPDYKSVLDIGPGCGYLSFFIKNNLKLHNYSQIEACESFYLLQYLVNLYCFGMRCDEKALPAINSNSLNYFSNQTNEIEFSPIVNLNKLNLVCKHYPWWKIGELINNQFDIVTSNANLLEFSPTALDDYLSLIHETLNPEGIFLVQCTGFEANGSIESLQDILYNKGFAPLFFVRAGDLISPPKINNDSLKLSSFLSKEKNELRKFTTNNILMIKKGHYLFDKYYKKNNFCFNFVASEILVKNIFFRNNSSRKLYNIQDFLSATEIKLKNIN